MKPTPDTGVPDDPAWALMDRLPLPMIVCDTQERVTRYNQAAQAALGKTDMGAPFQMLLGEEQVSTFQSVFDHIRAGRAPSPVDVALGIPPSQRQFRSIAAALDPERFAGALCVMALMDITADRRVAADSEQRLRSLSGRLALRVEEMDQLTYVIGHDLREPVRGIRNYVSFFLEDCAKDLDENCLRWLQTIDQLAQRLDSMLRVLLRYGRLEKIQLRMQPADVPAIARKVWAEILPSFPSISATLTVGDDLPPVTCDPGALTEVIRELFSNALTFNASPVKEVNVGVVAASMPGAASTVFVEDNGLGIPIEQREDAFKLFRRLHPRERFPMGLGAGLAIVRKLAQLHNGRAWIESSARGGARVCVSLAEESSLGQGSTQGAQQPSHPDH